MSMETSAAATDRHNTLSSSSTRNDGESGLEDSARSLGFIHFTEDSPVPPCQQLTAHKALEPYPVN